MALCLGGLLLSGPIISAGNGPATPLRLDQALQLSATQHPSVTAKRSESVAAGRFLDAAQWQRYPTFSLSSSAGDGGDTGTTARLQQPLWTGGRITSDINAAEARVVVAEAGIGEAEQSIMLRTATAYADALRARKRLEAATRNLEEHQRLFDLITRRMSNQVSSQTDQTLAQGRLNQAASEKIQFETALANAVSILTQLVGESVSASRLVEPGDRRRRFSRVDEALQAALEFAPQLQRLGAEETLARAELDSRRSVLWPQVSARLEQVNSNNNLITQNQSRALIVVEFQPGAGLGAASSIQGAAARIDAAKAGTEAARLDLTERVRTDWNESLALRSQVAPLRALARSTAEVTDSFLRQYTVGRKSWLDVLNAQREATQALFSLADAEASLLAASVRLELYTGAFVATLKPSR